MFPVLVEGNRLRLRELAAGDHRALCGVWGDPVVARYMGFSAMTAGEVERAIGEAIAQTRSRPRTDYTLGAARVADDVLVGTVQITVGEWRSVYCGRLTVARELQHQGYAAEMIELGFRFCFTMLKAHRVWGAVHVDNSAGKQTLLNAGMTFEGRMRDYFYARGEWHSVDRYSMLEDEWPLRVEHGNAGYRRSR